MKLEECYRKERGSGSGSETGYTVEAMHNYVNPISVAGQIFDNRWRQVEFKESAIGVPSCPRHHRYVAENGMLGYSAAQALRWWLHAQAESEHGMAICLETRIVSHRISYSYKVESVSAHDHVHGEDRSNCVPDWGKT